MKESFQIYEHKKNVRKERKKEDIIEILKNKIESLEKRVEFLFFENQKKSKEIKKLENEISILRNKEKALNKKVSTLDDRTRILK